MKFYTKRHIHGYVLLHESIHTYIRAGVNIHVWVICIRHTQTHTTTHNNYACAYVYLNTGAGIAYVV